MVVAVTQVSCPGLHPPSDEINTRLGNKNKNRQHQCRHATGASKPLRGKLLWVWSIPAILIPYVECFTFIEFGRSDPEVVFEWIAGPADKELLTTAMTAQVNDFINSEFFKAVWGDDRARLCKLSTRKQGIVTGDVSFQFWGMVDWESVCFDV